MLREGEGSPKKPDGGVENAIFSWREIGGKSRGALGQPAFFLAGNRMTVIVAFEKEVCLKAQ